MGAYEHVLVGLDLSPASAKQILTRASQLVDADAIDVIHVCDHLHKHHEDYPTGAFANSEKLDEAVIREADNHLDHYCQPFGITHHRVLGGNTARVIHQEAKDNVDAVVVGTHGRHGWRLLFGSTPNAVLHGTPCDVLAVRIDDDHPNAQPKNYEEILVAVNLEAESVAVMDHAQRIAETCGADMSACHVIEHHRTTVSREQAHRELGQLCEQYSIPADRRFVIDGHAPAQIHKLADQISSQLIVVGTHGKRGTQLVLGSTANAVLHGAECDALSVRVH